MSCHMSQRVMLLEFYSFHQQIDALLLLRYDCEAEDFSNVRHALPRDALKEEGNQ